MNREEEFKAKLRELGLDLDAQPNIPASFDRPAIRPEVRSYMEQKYPERLYSGPAYNAHDPLQGSNMVADASPDAPFPSNPQEPSTRISGSESTITKTKVKEDLPQPAKEAIDKQMAGLAEQPAAKEYVKNEYGFGEELDDAALKAAQKTAENRNLSAGIFEGIDSIARGLSGDTKQADSSFYDNLRKQAQQPVENIKTRREGIKQERAEERAGKEFEYKEGDLKKKAALQDPTSPESAAVRSIYKKLYPELASQLPEFDNLSAEDVKNYAEKAVDIKSKQEDRKLSREQLEENRAFNRMMQEEMLKSRKGEEDRRIVSEEEEAVKQYTDLVSKHGIADATNTLKEIENIINKPEYQGDLPGYGMAGGMVPNLATSKDGEKLRQLIQKLANIELKDRSGAAVTDPEYERFKKEFSQDTWLGQREQPLINKLQNYKSMLRTQLESYEPILHKQIGNRPKVIESYKQRGPGAITSDKISKDGVLSPKVYDQDVIDYAKQHGISEEKADEIKRKRLGMQ